jgi:ribosomal subunit interface protein
MQIQVHFQGIEHTPWMDEFITNRVEKIGRYLNPSSKIHVSLKAEKLKCFTTISIHNTNHDFAFSSDGVNVWESVSTAIDKANRVLSEKKRQFKDRINKRSSLNQYVA